MALPSKPILIRIVLWGGLISYVGYGAYQRHQAKAAAEAAVEAAKAADPLAPNSSIKLKDGSVMPVLELTEEEFEQQFGHKPPESAVTANELKQAMDDAKDQSPPTKPEVAPAAAPAPEPVADPEANPEGDAQAEGGGLNREHTLQ